MRNYDLIKHVMIVNVGLETPKQQVAWSSAWSMTQDKSSKCKNKKAIKPFTAQQFNIMIQQIMSHPKVQKSMYFNIKITGIECSIHYYHVMDHVTTVKLVSPCQKGPFFNTFTPFLVQGTSFIVDHVTMTTAVIIRQLQISHDI